MSEELIVRNAAPTLAGMKTGSLFSCRFSSQAQLIGEIRQINRRLAHKGLRLIPLRFSGDTALLYLYRPGRLQGDLQNDEARQLLSEAGYDDLRPGRCLPQLMERLRGSGEFPHEIGLFLSYPPEDVRGFIQHKGKNCKAVGCWKVYGDADQARRRFAAYHRCTDCLCRQLAMGVSMEHLCAAPHLS